MSAGSTSLKPISNFAPGAPFRVGPDGLFGRPKRAPGGNGIPVIVVTGFLGAGKTTLIRALLDSKDGANSAVIVNEFGEIGIDDALLRAGSDATVLLGNGCVCCRHSSELEATLRGLFIDRSRGAVPSYERVLIETSGLADPGPILQSFLAERGLHETYGLQQLVTVIDAVSGAANIDTYPEARRQVALADLIIITKTDLAPPQAIERLEAQLRSLNGSAGIVLAEAGKGASQALISGSMVQALAERAMSGHAAHSTGIGSFVLSFDTPLDWPAFALTMQMLAALRGADLLRVKGLLGGGRSAGAGRGPLCAASRASADGAQELAGWRSPLQAGFHHAQYREAGRRRSVRRGVPAATARRALRSGVRARSWQIGIPDRVKPPGLLLKHFDEGSRSGR